MRTVLKALGATLVSASFFAPAFAADLKSYQVVGSARINPGVAVGLNPQPLPPGGTAGQFVFVGKRNPGAAVSLNPQPLPPRSNAAQFVFAGQGNPGAAVSLNPQPLPPGGTGFNARRVVGR